MEQENSSRLSEACGNKVRQSYQQQQSVFGSSRRTQKTPKPQLIRPLKKSFSTEFFLRAKQWRDVAEFERKELLKVRVIRSLRQVSDALLAVSFVTSILSVVDLELNYALKGTQLPTDRPPAWGVPCQFSWNTTSGGFGFRDNQGLKDFLSLCQFGTRLLISFITLVTLTMVYWYTELERRLFVVRNHLSDTIGLMESPLAPKLCVELFACMIHIPPGVTAIVPEFQLFTFVRLYNITKYMQEHHPMRYNRMTEILKNLAEIRLPTAFLIKSYFTKSPSSILWGLYFWNLFVLSFIIYSLERMSGTCMVYSDVIWMTAVTITNLGYGEFTPSFWLSRVIVSLLSIFGIVQTALIVSVVQKKLAIPSDQQRILAYIDWTRITKLQEEAAAKLIQISWRRYKYAKVRIGDDDDFVLRESQIASFSASYRNKNFKDELMSRRRSSAKRTSQFGNPAAQRYRNAGSSAKAFHEALWEFRKVKIEAQRFDRSKEFQADDTAQTVELISRKLDLIEKIVRKGQTFGGDPDAARSKWVTGGIGALNQKLKKAAAPKPKIEEDNELMTSLKHLLADQKGIKDQLRTIRKSIAIPKSSSNVDDPPPYDRHPSNMDSDDSSDSQEGLNQFRRDPDQHNQGRRKGFDAM